MRQIFKLTVTLTGLMLLLITGCLWLARHGSSGPRPEVLQEVNFEGRLLWHLPGSTIERPLTPALSFVEILAQSPDQQWLYWSSVQPGNIYGDGEPVGFYRIRINGGAMELITEVVYNHVYISPNAKWLVFEHLNPDFTGDLYRIRTDGRDPLVLTEGFDHPIKFDTSRIPFFFPVQISPDSQWVYFTAKDARDLLQIYRVPMLGGPIEQLTDFDDPDLSLVYWSPDWAWPMVRRNGLLYWMNQAGTTFRPVVEGQANLTAMYLTDVTPDAVELSLETPDGIRPLRLDPASGATLEEIIPVAPNPNVTIVAIGNGTSIVFVPSTRVVVMGPPFSFAWHPIGLVGVSTLLVGLSGLRWRRPKN